MLDDVTALSATQRNTNVTPQVDKNKLNRKLQNSDNDVTRTAAAYTPGHQLLDVSTRAAQCSGRRCRRVTSIASR